MLSSTSHHQQIQSKSRLLWLLCSRSKSSGALSSVRPRPSSACSSQPRGLNSHRQCTSVCPPCCPCQWSSSCCCFSANFSLNRAGILTVSRFTTVRELQPRCLSLCSSLSTVSDLILAFSVSPVASIERVICTAL